MSLPLPEAPRHRLIIPILWVLVFASFAQMTMVSPLIPRIAEALTVSEAAVGLIITAHGLVLGLATLIAGPISDRIGRRRILMISSPVLVVALAGHAVADDLLTLAILRALSGAGAGITLAGAIAYLGDSFPRHRRGWATGWTMSGFAAAQILGGPLAALVGGIAGYKLPFLLLAVVAALGALAVWQALPSTNIARSDRIRIRETLATYGALLGNPTTRAACLCYFAMLFGISTFVTYLPHWLEIDVGLSAPMIAAVLMLGGVGNAIAGPTAGALSDMVGRPVLVAVGSLWAGLMMVLVPHLGFAVWAVFLGFWLLMLGISTRGSVMQALVTELVPDHQRGRFVSLNLAVGHLGFGLGALVASPVYAWGGFGPTGALAALTGPAIAALALTRLRRAVPPPLA